MKRYKFCITIAAQADTPEQAWEEACQAFALDPGSMPEDFKEESEDE